MDATYVSATSFTVVGDQTTIFVAGRRVKCNCGVDGYDYGSIVSSSYGDPNTTVTLTTASDDITANLTSVEWSAVTPNSVPSGIKNVIVKCIADDTVLTTGDGKMYFTVPIELNGMDLISVGGHVYTVSSSGLPSFQIHNLTDTVDMLSTLLTIDENEKDSKDAVTPAVINTATDDVATGDELRFDCDIAGTSTKGMEIRMGFQFS